METKRDQSYYTLPAGSPVIAVGLNRELAGSPCDASSLPVVLAGRLAESRPFEDAGLRHGFILEDGPFAGNIAAKGVTEEQSLFNDEGAAIVLLTRTEPDERNCVFYMVVEDLHGVVAAVEAGPPGNASEFQSAQDRLYREACSRFAPLLAPLFQNPFYSGL